MLLALHYGGLVDLFLFGRKGVREERRQVIILLLAARNGRRCDWSASGGRVIPHLDTTPAWVSVRHPVPWLGGAEVLS